mgnify:CR=1 FL=1
MSGGIYVAASGALLQQMRLDLLTNNLANVNSPGYKADKPIFRLPAEVADAAASRNQNPALRQSVSPYTPPFDSVIDVSAGPLKKTGNPLDVAIEGPAFFAVDTPDGEQYTRKGSFIVDADGNLTTADGFAVLGQGGPISVTGSQVQIDASGKVSADGKEVGQLRLVRFDAPEALEKTGDALFAANDPDNPFGVGTIYDRDEINAAFPTDITQVVFKSATIQRPKAEPGNDNHVGAPMPGVVASVGAVAGAKVKAGDLLLTIEAMKMETGIHAERDAVVKAVHVGTGDGIDAKDLLVEFE